MATQLSVAVRNARINAIEATIGPAAVFRIYTGAQPANCAASNSGTLLAEMTVPADWMAAASSGSATLLGTWQDPSANATNTAGHYRGYESTGTTCHIQGSVSITGGGGDMQLDNTSIAAGQVVTITAFTLTDGNA